MNMSVISCYLQTCCTKITTFIKSLPIFFHFSVQFSFSSAALNALPYSCSPILKKCSPTPEKMTSPESVHVEINQLFIKQSFPVYIMPPPSRGGEVISPSDTASLWAERLALWIKILSVFCMGLVPLLALLLRKFPPSSEVADELKNYLGGSSFFTIASYIISTHIKVSSPLILKKSKGLISLTLVWVVSFISGLYCLGYLSLSLAKSRQ